jgi:hypothetical protein
MSSMYQPQNDPDPVWHTGPLTPVPAPALTAEEEADWEAWQDHVEHMQMTGIGQRAESDPNWEAPAPWPGRPVTWEACRSAENETEPEAEAGQ